MPWKPRIFGSAKNKPPPLPFLSGLGGGRGLSYTSQLGSSPSREAWWALLSLLRQRGGGEGSRPGPPGRTAEGETGGGLLARGDPHPRPRCPNCLLCGGSQSDLVRGLTVPKCVTFSTLCAGRFRGEKRFVRFLAAACTQSVRTENVKHQISNMTKNSIMELKDFYNGSRF